MASDSGKNLDEHICSLLQKVLDEYWKEDRDIRERQIRKYRHLKLLWDGFSRVYWDETAHDWRVWENDTQSADGNQEFYDKPVNVFKAYGETIIAALSVLVPPVKCYPDDADNALDLLTARAGDKIAQLIDRHNSKDILWLQSLFIYFTEGAVACYTYSKEDYKYGSYEENKYEDIQETHEYTICSVCNTQLADEIVNADVREEFSPDDEDAEIHAMQDEEMVFCPQCMADVSPTSHKDNLTITRLVGVTKNPKSRVCQEVYGGLYVKIPNYAKKQADMPYLIQSYETNYALARDRFPEIRDKIQPSAVSPDDNWGRWGRQNTLYQGDESSNQVTIRNVWLRPAAFEVLSAEEVKELKKEFPDGARVSAVNDHVAEYENENLDDCWTVTQNPLSDYLTFEPPGMQLVSTQELTNDLVSLGEQTLEHGIPQTFADQNVLDFQEYGQMETTPGAIYPAKARTGKSLSEGFHEVRTAVFPAELLPWFQQIQALGQLAVGAQPTLFGGDIQGSKTASEYSMSRQQALQRLQTSWKMFTAWRRDIMAKAIPLYIKNVKDDEKFVERDSSNNFINVFIRKSELEGKLGQIELEANENLPITWSQKKDIILQMMEANNPQIWQMMATPENLPLIYDTIGIPDFSVPGEDSRNKQYDEIKLLTTQEPLFEEVPEEEIALAQMAQMEPPQGEELPSIEPEEFDVHAVELEIVIKWLNSPAGQLAKVENPAGYRNVVLHGRMHKAFMMMEMQEQMMMGAGGEAQGEAPLPNAKEDTTAPKAGAKDVKTN